MCGDSGIDSILIDHPERMARLKQRHEAENDQITTELMLTRALMIILCLGLLALVVGNTVYIAKGRAITQPPVKASHEKGR